MTYQAPVQRKSKAPRRILITLLVLVVLLVVADRVGDLVAENYAADKLQQSQKLPNEVDVDIHGFPFLTQLAAGEYDDVTLTTTDVPVGGKRGVLTLNQVVVNLDHLTVGNSYHRFDVETARATATASYASLSDLLGVKVEYGGDDNLKASKEISLFGYKINPTVTVRPETITDGLRFAGAQASGLGPLASSLNDVAENIFGTSLPLESLPFDVDIKGVTATPAGLELKLRGDDLTYTR